MRQGIMARTKLLIIVPLVLALLVVGLYGCSSGGGSSTKSEPIVGHWNSYGLFEEASGTSSYKSGTVDAGADGTFSLMEQGRVIESGSWEALPKSDWLGKDSVGEYIVNRKNKPGSVFRVHIDNKGIMTLIMTDNPLSALYLQKSS